MLGVHYSRAVSDLGVVPYVFEEGSQLCCDLQPSDLSRVHGTPVSDENLQIGSVLSERFPNNRKLVALIAEIMPIPE